MRSPIEAKRLTLRFMTEADTSAVNRLTQDKRIHTMVGHLPPNLPLEATASWILTHVTARLIQTDFIYSVFKNGHLIGCVGLHRASIKLPFALGYWLDPDAWGQGFATEMVEVVIAELERSYGPQVIKAGVFEDNPASGRVLEKNGFKFVDKTMEHCAGRGEFVQHINMQRDP